MTRVDQFESTFRAAAKAVYEHSSPEIGSVLVVTDLDADAAKEFTKHTRAFLEVLEPDTKWATITGEEFREVDDLLQLVERFSPGMVITYRHLHSSAWKWPHGLGEHVDVLTQVAGCPILVQPHPSEDDYRVRTGTGVVMAITDHLTGDHLLVNWAARLTAVGGTLYLTHVEDDGVFERYMQTISKIPSIDTDHARETMVAQLLKEPADYIDSCREVLAEHHAQITVKAIVALGHRLREYKKLVEKHAVDLLIMNTKDEDQFAMHGMAYPLAVELRTLPLLML